MASTSADDRGKQIRDRLKRAGMLAESPPTTKQRPDAEALRAAGSRAGQGTPLSDLVAEGRGPVSAA